MTPMTPLASGFMINLADIRVFYLLMPVDIAIRQAFLYQADIS